MAVLKEFGSSYNLARTNLTHIKNVLKPKEICGKLDIDASSLHDNAKKSIGENNEVITLEIKMLIDNIELLTSQLKTADKKNRKISC